MGAKPITLGPKIGVLAAAAIVPFVVSLIPPGSSILIFFYPITYPLCIVYGLSWCALFYYFYRNLAERDRPSFLWCGLLAIFAFVLPIHIFLALLGHSSALPTNVAPP